MADTIGLSDVTYKIPNRQGKIDKETGNSRMYNMAKCKPGQVYDQKLKKCRFQKKVQTQT